MKTAKAFGIGAIVLLLFFAIAVFPQMLGVQNGGPHHTQSAIHGLESALKLYALEHDDQYPVDKTEQVVKALVETGTDPATNQPVESLLEEWPTDEWGSPLKYEFPSDKSIQKIGKPAIWSVGSDKIDGTDDDLNNWDDLDELEY